MAVLISLFCFARALEAPPPAAVPPSTPHAGLPQASAPVQPRLEPPVAVVPPAPLAPEPAPEPESVVEEPHAGHAHAEQPDPFGDLAYYKTYPMSRVPHHVVRGWGVGPDSNNPGHVAAYVVVDPKIGDAALAKLANDIHEFHRDADAVAVRIVDDELAATYDRHSDGGTFLEEHLIGRVQRDERLGTNLVEVRGKAVSKP